MSSRIDGASTFPKGIIPMRNQIAGHTFGHKSLGMLESYDDGAGYVYKPLLPPPRGHSELTFYTDMFTPQHEQPSASTDRTLIQPFLPAFHGMVRLPVNNQLETFLKLENINTPFNAPCAMDIKMGKVSYDPLASQDKQAKESSKSSYQKECGFRILGMNVPETSQTKEIILNKSFCKSIQQADLIAVLDRYLIAATSVSVQHRVSVVDGFIERLSRLLGVFAVQTRFSFYASSLLFVYEGEPARGPAGPAGPAPAPGTRRTLTDLRMIDFAHVFTDQGGIDENYVHGIRHLIKLFNDLRDGH